MAVLAQKQGFPLKFMQCASIISFETFWKIYLNWWINLEFLWLSLKVLRTSTRKGFSWKLMWKTLNLRNYFLSFWLLNGVLKKWSFKFWNIEDGQLGNLFLNALSEHKEIKIRGHKFNLKCYPDMKPIRWLVSVVDGPVLSNSRDVSQYDGQFNSSELRVANLYVRSIRVHYPEEPKICSTKQSVRKSMDGT